MKNRIIRSGNDLDFNKVVKGNQGSKDKYFKFTVKLLNSGDQTVDPSDRYIIHAADSVYDPQPVKNAVTRDEYTAAVMEEANQDDIHKTDGADVHYVTYAQLTAGKDFYLHSGQNIKILGIPDNLGYEITEVQEDYTPEASAKVMTGLDSTAAASLVEAVNEGEDASYKITDPALTADAEVTFTNTKGGAIPTGVLMSTAFPAAVIAVAAAGAVGCLYYFKKKSEEE